MERGLDPIWIIRAPDQAYVDTKFDTVQDMAARAAVPEGALVYPKRDAAIRQ